MNTTIISEFGFFQKIVEIDFLDSVELRESSFSKTPETLYSVDMLRSSGELITPMMNTIVFLIPNIHQSIICSPSITVNFRFFYFHFSSDYWHQSHCFHIRNNLCVDLPISLEQTKYYCLHTSSSSPLSSDTSRSEI